jgi:rod shape-determining protein MreD
VEELGAENTRLRALIDLKPALPVKSVAADVLYEASDPFSRKLFIDRGASHGVVPGAPVINEAGVLGQVTRVYPMSSEVTLVVDKEAAIPVLNTRTHQRSAAFGLDGTALELRFMAGNSDVKVGDLLQTSGVDGIYPPGLDVARVSKVDPRADSAFARIALLPTATADGVRHVLVLEPVAMQLPTRPDIEAEAASAAAPKGKGAKGRQEMILARGTDDQLLLPVNPLFLWFSLLAALIFNMLPFGRVAAMPDVLALTLVFWNVQQPRRVGIGAAFVFGLLMDVHQGSVLGQHAQAYTLLSFLAITIHRRLLWFSLAEQALQILPLFIAAHAVSLVVRLLSSGSFPGWTLLLAPLFEALLWPVITMLLLAPQRRAPDRDENRPL